VAIFSKGQERLKTFFSGMGMENIFKILKFFSCMYSVQRILTGSLIVRTMAFLIADDALY